MEQETELYCGLDIGSAYVTAVIGRPAPLGRLEILGLGRVPTKGINNGELIVVVQIANCIKQAVKEASDKANAEIKVVNVGLSTSSLISYVRNNSFIKDDADSVFTEKHVWDFNRLMYKIHTEAGSEIVHVLPQEYQIDDREVGPTPVGSLGIKLQADFNILAVPDQLMRTLKASIKSAGLEMGRLVMEPLASAFSVLTPEEKDEGVALVDMGAHYTSIVIFWRGGIRHVEILPFGGSLLTRDLKDGCGIRHKQAVMLKEQFGCALTEEADPEEQVSIPWHRRNEEKRISVRNVARILEAALEEIVRDLHSHLIKSGYEDKLHSIVLTGGTANLREIDNMFEYMTGIPTRIGRPDEYLSDNCVQMAQDPALSTVVGLALAEQLPEEERRFMTPSTTVQQETLSPTRSKGQAKREGKAWMQRSFEIFRNILNDDFDNKNY